MNRKSKAIFLILLFVLDLNAGPYKFKSENGKNFLVIDEDYLKSKKEEEIINQKREIIKASNQKKRNRFLKKVKARKRLIRRRSTGLPFYTE